MDSLDGRRSNGVEPLRPEKFYPALVEALRRERISLSVYQDQPILWVNGNYRSPGETLVGPRIPRCFGLAVPVFRGVASVGHAYLQLGASAYPAERHWEALFLHFSELYPGEGEILPHTERRALRDAYRLRAHRGLPESLPPTTQCLLSRDGTLWPAPGSEDTELGVLMELEVGHGETEVYARVQA
jgi:hypothetical protein